VGLREAFVARPGCVLVSADYSQIEMRLMAHFSRDASLIAALQAHPPTHRSTHCEHGQRDTHCSTGDRTVRDVLLQ
jgi:DNA polymerase-1